MRDGEVLEEKVFTMGSDDYVLLKAEYDVVKGAGVVRLNVELNGEVGILTFDRSHFRELRLAVNRLAKFIEP